MKSLSESQRRALKKLMSNPKKYLSAYSLNEGLGTLNSLWNKVFIEFNGMKLVVRRKGVSGLGSQFSPRTNIVFRVFRKKETK